MINSSKSTKCQGTWHHHKAHMQAKGVGDESTFEESDLAISSCFSHLNPFLAGFCSDCQEHESRSRQSLRFESQPRKSVRLLLGIAI